MDEKLTVAIGARISDFTRKMKRASKSIKSLPNKVSTKITAKTDQFHKAMDSLASKINALGTVAGNAFKGGLLSVLPALSPIIGSLVGGLGALASSLAAVGGGLAVFGLAAIGNATKLGTSMEELKSISEKVNAERAKSKPNIEKINQLLNKRNSILSGMSKHQKTAMKQVNKFKDAWSNFLKETEQPVFEAFADGLMVATTLLKKIQPIVDPISDSLSVLLRRFNAFAKTDQFKSFIDFFANRGSSALMNWGTIAGNVLTGFMELMKAFGPLGKDMENGLIGLTEKFAQWAAGLKNSKSFQKFVNFVKTNGPKVMSLIGNITDFIIQLGIGMAPLGQKILTLTNSFLSWITQMMKANPVIGKVIAWITSLGGVMLALTPFIIALKVAFGGMAKFIWLKTGMMRAKLVTGVTMMIKSLGKFIAKMATMVAQFVVKSAVFIAKWAMMGAKALLHAAKMALAWTIATGKKMAVAAAKMVATSAMFAAKWAWMGVKALLHAAKMAAAWFIALGPVGWVIATVIALVALIIANWDKVSSWTKKAWSAVWNWIKDTWSKIVSGVSGWISNVVSFVTNGFNKAKSVVSAVMSATWSVIQNTWNNIVSAISNAVSNVKSAITSGLNAALDFVKGLGSSFLAAGRGLIEMMAKGIRNAIGAVTSAVSSVASKVRDFLPFSPAKTGPLSDIDKLNFGGPISDSIRRATSGVQRELASMLAMPTINPSSVYSKVGGSIRGGAGQVNNSTDNRTINFSVDASNIDELNQVIETFAGFKQAIRKG